MRLVSCHIENFGKLSNKDFNFNEGLNVELRENGWGKSTLSIFIRAMFYGLENDSKRDDIENERRRFNPWQGGAFGGNLVFEVNERQYKIERFFGAKAAGDTFLLRDATTNLISEDYSSNIGEELFQINMESFSRTVFIRQSDCVNFGATDDINAKLGNITDGIDLNRFAKADTALNDALNTYSATRRTGEIAKLKSKESELRAEVSKGESLEQTISSVEERIADTKEEIDVLKDKIKSFNEKKKEASEFQTLKKDKEAYENLKHEVLEKDKAYHDRVSRFTKGIPSKETCDQWEKAAGELTANREVVEKTQMSDSENSLYMSLLTIFENNIPDENEIIELISKANELNRLRNVTKQFSLSDREKDRYTRLHDKYGDTEVAEEAVNGVVKALNLKNKYVSQKQLVGEDIATRENELSNLRNKGNGHLALIAVGILGMLSGFLLILLKDNANMLGAVCLVLGLIVLFLGLISWKKKNSASLDLQSDLKLLQNKYDELKNVIEEIDFENSRTASRYGFEITDGDMTKVFSGIFNDIFELNSISVKLVEAGINDHQLRCDELNAKINEYLHSYNVYAKEEEYPAKLTELKGQADHFKTLRDKATQCTKAKLNERRLKEELLDQLMFYGIEPGMDIEKTIDDVIDIVIEAEGLKELLNDVKIRMNSFEATHNLDRLIDDELPVGMDFDEIVKQENELNEELDTLRNKLNKDIRTRDDYAEEYENWLETVEELNQVREDIANKQKRLEYIRLTEKYLSSAKETLTARYIEPLMKGFTHYYSILTGESSEKYLMDANTVITKEEQGKQRDTRLLSFGYQDLIGFCLRLAIADAMYSKEKPVLIMDDPFVNLDDKKIEGAKTLLRQASEKYQIIYLTCRENRL